MHFVRDVRINADYILKQNPFNHFVFVSETKCIFCELATEYVEIKCQLDLTEVFIADLIACSTCFGHHCAHHQELKSIIRWLLLVVFCAVVFSSSRSGVELRVMRPVCRMLVYQHPANRTHNPQLHTRPAT